MLRLKLIEWPPDFLATSQSSRLRRKETHQGKVRNYSIRICVYDLDAPLRKSHQQRPRVTTNRDIANKSSKLHNTLAKQSTCHRSHTRKPRTIRETWYQRRRHIADVDRHAITR